MFIRLGPADRTIRYISQADRNVSVVRFRPHAFEKRVAEDPVVFGGSVEGPNPFVEALRGDDSGADGLLANGLDHRRERLAREAVDEMGPARIDIDHPR